MENVKDIINSASETEDYNGFRKHYTEEIKEMIKVNDGKFVMTHQLSACIMIDVINLIKKAGYNITK